MLEAQSEDASHLLALSSLAGQAGGEELAAT
jgi:hypothetical protein